MHHEYRPNWAVVGAEHSSYAPSVRYDVHYRPRTRIASRVMLAVGDTTDAGHARKLWPDARQLMGEPV